MGKHASERAAIAMAPKVHAGHWVEFGPLQAVGAGGEEGAPENYLKIEE